jgi:L-histidine N-alpha-methyltransferase
MSPDTITEPTFDRHLSDDWREQALLADVTAGLGSLPRRLTPRWLYDDRGSELYSEITRLPEYYLTEAERAVLRRAAGDIVELSGADTLIELGSGTSDKTTTLLDAFAAADRLERFVPLDVSEQTLRDAAADLAERYPGLQVHGVIGDFVEHLTDVPHEGVPLLAFLGSTIGNFYPAERAEFFRAVSGWLPDEGHLLLGVDLVKPVDRIMAAYNDAAGVTAEFTLNVLEVLNRELDADFDLSAFEHVGMWDPNHTRVDLRLRALRDQHVVIRRTGMELDIAEDEEIRAEISTKFTFRQLDAEFADAGLEAVRAWTSDGGEVALVLIRRA